MLIVKEKIRATLTPNKAAVTSAQLSEYWRPTPYWFIYHHFEYFATFYFTLNHLCEVFLLSGFSMVYIMRIQFFLWLFGTKKGTRNFKWNSVIEDGKYCDSKKLKIQVTEYSELKSHVGLYMDNPTTAGISANQ